MLWGARARACAWTQLWRGRIEYVYVYVTTLPNYCLPSLSIRSRVACAAPLLAIFATSELERGRSIVEERAAEIMSEWDNDWEVAGWGLADSSERGSLEIRQEMDLAVLDRCCLEEPDGPVDRGMEVTPGFADFCVLNGLPRCLS